MFDKTNVIRNLRIMFATVSYLPSEDFDAMPIRVESVIVLLATANATPTERIVSNAEQSKVDSDILTAHLFVSKSYCSASVNIFYIVV